MNLQRIPPLEAPFSKSVQDSFSIIMPPDFPPLNIFRTVGRNERVLSRMVRGGLLDKGSVTVGQRELVILRTCAICHAEYEWGVHVTGFAEKAKLSKQQVAATRDPVIDQELWSAEQQLLLRMADELHESADLSDDLWAALQKQFSDEQLIELVMLAGLYHAVSFVANSFRLEKEEFAPPFPPAN